MTLPHKNLVGAATRYIAGRKAMQTVYWRSQGLSGDQHKFVKVLKTFNFGKDPRNAPAYMRQEQQYKV